MDYTYPDLFYYVSGAVLIISVSWYFFDILGVIMSIGVVLPVTFPVIFYLVTGIDPQYYPPLDCEDYYLLDLY